jgi:predicted small metal-binding protein
MAKKLTCRDLGGPCDFEMLGATPDEVVGKGAAHLQEMSEKGDVPHKEAMDMMNNSDEAAKGEWFKKFGETFANAPDA